MEKLKVLIAAATAEMREEAAQVLQSDRLQTVAKLAADSVGLEKAGAIPADVLVLYSDCLDRRESDFIERLYMTRPSLLCLLLCTETDGNMLQRAMNCGISRIIELANTKETPAEAVLSLYNREQNRLQASASGQIGYESRVLAFFGTKGGVGKTTVAVNTAVALAKMNKRVALLDFDLQFGDVGVFLDIVKSDTIVDMVEENDYDYAALASFLYKHHSGVRVLCAPTGPEYAELIKPEHIEKIILGLRGEFDYIIIDMPPAFTDISLSALEQCSQVFFVINPDISSLRNAQVSFHVLESLNLRDRLRLIVNRDGFSNLKRKDIEDVLGSQAVLLLPCDYKNCAKAVNRGAPLVMSYPRSKISIAIGQFAKELARSAGGSLSAKKGRRK